VSKNFHTDSIFGPGPRVRLDRERRAQFRAKIKLQRRPGRLTIAAAAVALVLLDLLGPDGRLDPTLATLAVLACVSVATVKRALADLKEFGFLNWTRRLIRGADTGWRAEQTSNAYVLRVPSSVAQNELGVILKNLRRKSPYNESRAREAGVGWEAQVQERDRQLATLGINPDAARAGLEAISRHRAGTIAALLRGSAAPA
jgi:hypothetical protein